MCRVGRSPMLKTPHCLARAVTELGVGLLTVGGNRSFGAGGWLGSELADVFPLDCQPPQTKELPGGAIAMVMHSCEMPEGNYWGRRVAEAAIETLHPSDFVGMVEFDWDAFRGDDENAGCVWVLPMQRVGDRTTAFAATAALTYGDMPDFDPSMELAIAGLAETPAAMRQIIVISDGDPSPPTPATIAEATNNRVQITTVMVGGTDRVKIKWRWKPPRLPPVVASSKWTTPTSSPPSLFAKLAHLTKSYSRRRVRHAFDAARFGGRSIGRFVVSSAGTRLGAHWHSGGTASLGAGLDTGEDEPDPLVAWWSAGARTIGRHHHRCRVGCGRTTGSTGRSTTDSGNNWHVGPCVLVSLEISRCGPIERGSGRLWRSRRWMKIPLRCCVALKRWRSGPRRTDSAQTSASRSASWRSEFPLREEGSWFVSVAGRRPGESSVDRLLGAIDMPYPEEFRALRDNAAALERVARRTSGRVLTGSESLFTRDGLSFREARLPVWDVALILAAVVFLLDVAVRRLALDWSSLFRREVVEAPETTWPVGSPLRVIRAERVAKARGVEGQDRRRHLNLIRPNRMPRHPKSLQTNRPPTALPPCSVCWMPNAKSSRGKKHEQSRTQVGERLAFEVERHIVGDPAPVHRADVDVAGGGPCVVGISARIGQDHFGANRGHRSGFGFGPGAMHARPHAHGCHRRRCGSA